MQKSSHARATWSETFRISQKRRHVQTWDIKLWTKQMTFENDCKKK